jgi:O-antigen/teichoic acid export membrane protein
MFLCNSAWIISPMGISQITTSILNALNQEQKSFIYFVISSIFMFMSVLVLAKFVGIMAMAYSIGISNIVLAILNINKIKKLTNYSPQIIKKLSTQLLITIPVILICKLSFNWTHLLFGDMFCIIICSAISIVSYTMLLFVFNVINFSNIKTFVSKNLKKKPNKI